ncbi:polyribonucleotide nucleotidyltransferase [Planctomicrobium piriforme]|uniref:Polyribonucleotide nucleotidyltransferase n=1 Tax=Planctomicrobium piriforme TaxID=1576369 RepID=A0A1I3DKF9_9PLAN|nr:polyribonucleotide nucleotidyltransferase [Planctomicrobium piriforme]SFH87242.1 polyribonucleotide nucleotidyltransferase [Planctomicrobium piriforme]
MKIQVSREIAGRTLTLTTGQIAKQASGAVILQYGETTVFVASQTGPARPGQDFFPLTCDYRERYAAAGKFPGGFLKRESRPSTREILTSRLTDRPIRPLFPEGYIDELQIQANVLSYDGENDPDVLSINAASASLCISPVPFNGPIGAVRVGLVDGEFILMPTIEQIKVSSLDLIVAGTKESILMIEGFGDQIPEDQMVDALMFGHRAVVELCDLQEELRSKAGVTPFKFVAPPVNPFLAIVREEAAEKIRASRQNIKKSERSSATAAVRDELMAKYFPAGKDVLEDGRSKAQLKEAFHSVDNQVCRELTLSGHRLDGRSFNDLRQIECMVDVIPRVHGSALFTRGETQSLATVVLGSVRDAQKVDSIIEESAESFYLHYNFPSYSVGEVRPIRGPGRREIGHGALAQRSVERVMPKKEDFPYTVRVISDITESNGSSSMASVCSATLSLMAAGVPITQPVAGISIGLVKEGDKYATLTDIIGDEDHFGDMDFKVAGSQKGITGIQLDLKNDGINEEIIRKTLDQARTARRELLRTMLTTIRRPRPELPESAPRIVSIKIDPEKIGMVIGPSGKMIRAIQEESGTQVDIVDDGTVTIAGPNKEACSMALARIEAMTEEIKVGRVYTGKVNSIKDFGAFVEIAPGKDGLLHISELSDGYVKSVTDVVKIGDMIEVKVIAVDDQNRVKLSRKALLAAKAPAPAEDVDDDDDEDAEE